MADAFSRKGEQKEVIEESLAMISFPDPTQVKELRNSYRKSLEFSKLVDQLSKLNTTLKGYQLQQRLLVNNGRIVAVSYSLFKWKVMHYIYDNLLEGNQVFQDVSTC